MEKKKVLNTQNTKGTSYNSIALLYCLLISLFFWLSLKLSQERSYNINIPVEYAVPDGKTNLQDLPSTIPYTLRAKTGNLMLLNFRFQRKPLKIILDGNTISQQDLSDALRNRLSKKIQSINTGFSIENLQLDSLISKSVPLTINADISTMEGYYISEKKISPSSIEITGASSVIRNIDSLALSKLVLQDVKESYQDSLFIIKSLSERIRLSQDKALLEIRIDQMVEKKISFYSALLDNTISLSASVPASQFTDIDSTQFEVIVDNELVTLISKNPLIKILQYSFSNN